jgi:hypothetical protein
MGIADCQLRIAGSRVLMVWPIRLLQMVFLCCLSPGLAHLEAGIQLRVTDWQCSIKGKAVQIRGKVENHSGIPLMGVQANMWLMNIEGDILGQGTGPVKEKILLNEKGTTFDFRFSYKGGKVDRCQLWFKNPQTQVLGALVPDPRP